MWSDFLADAGAKFIPTLVMLFNTILDAWPTIEPMPYFVFHDGSVRDYNGPQQPYIRPAMTLPNSLYVSDDGYVTTNQAPTAPGSITYGTPRAAKPLDLTLTAATDPD